MLNLRKDQLRPLSVCKRLEKKCANTDLSLVKPSWQLLRCRSVHFYGGKGLQPSLCPCAATSPCRMGPVGHFAIFLSVVCSSAGEKKSVPRLLPNFSKFGKIINISLQLEPIWTSVRNNASSWLSPNTNPNFLNVLHSYFFKFNIRVILKAF